MLENEVDIVQALHAQSMAVVAHRKAGSTYNGGLYEDHLRDVVHVLREFGFTSVLLEISAWLHDTIEDTDLTLEDIRAKGFPDGESVVKIVGAVTTPASVGNRKARLEKLIEQLTANPEAIPLKLADRIANVRSCWKNRDTKLFMYEREYRRFRDALRNVSPPMPRPVAGMEMMWRELDSLHGWWDGTKR